MTRLCIECGEHYDDAKRVTLCPHTLLKSPEEEEQFEKGYKLLGEWVSFAHEPEGQKYRVCSLRYDGMVALDGMTGEFAPSLFVVRGG